MRIPASAPVLTTRTASAVVCPSSFFLRPVGSSDGDSFPFSLPRTVDGCIRQSRAVLCCFLHWTVHKPTTTTTPNQTKRDRRGVGSVHCRGFKLQLPYCDNGDPFDGFLLYSPLSALFRARKTICPLWSSCSAASMQPALMYWVEVAR